MFKYFLNQNPNYKEQKDKYTVIAIYYLLYKNNFCDKNRLLPFETSCEGLYSPEWSKTITARDLLKDYKVKKFSKEAQKILNLLKTTSIKSSREFEVGMRNILIGTAAVAYMEDNVFSKNDTEIIKEQKFNKTFVFLKGMYGVYNKNLKRICLAKNELMKDTKEKKD